MLQVANQQQIHRVAIIDDDDDWRDQLCWLVEDGGYEPICLTGPYGNDLNRLVDEAAKAADLVLCDYNLAPSGLAQFKGALVVEELYRRRKPSALVTSFRTEATELIYKRRSIPKIIDRDQFAPEGILPLFEGCLMEFANNPPSERRAHRTLIHVAEIKDEGTTSAKVIAFLPAWNSERAVSFPLDLVDAPVRSLVRKGGWLLAYVNIGASIEEDLFYLDFQIAPELDDNDGLA